MKKLLVKKTHNKHKLNFTFKNHFIRYGDLGIKALSEGFISETITSSIQRYLQRAVKINKNSTKFWNLLQVSNTITALSPESRMGKGKGSILHQMSKVKKGQILFEFSGISFHDLNLIIRNISKKLPFQIKICR